MKKLYQLLPVIVTSSLLLTSDLSAKENDTATSAAANHNKAVPMLAGPLTGEYFWHELFGHHDIGYYYESPVGLVGDNETHFISFEMNTNTLFEDPTMHLVVSVSGDTFVRTNNTREITSLNDVQLGGRGMILGALYRDPNVLPDCANGTMSVGIEDFSINRGAGSGVPIPLCESWANANFQMHSFTDYKFEIAASKSHTAYHIYQDVNPYPFITQWQLIYNNSVAAPQQANDHYYGNVVIGAASRSSSSSTLDLTNVYIGKFGAPASHVPEITSVVISCLNDYCASVYGDNFDADASVLVRKANQMLGDEVVEFSGNDIYRRKFSDPNDFIFFPIQDLDLQAAWNDEGLCFTVKNSQGVSNESCRQRVTNPIMPKFMGQQVQSYNAAQDLEHTSFVVKGNASPLEGGDLLKIWGNSWKSINYNYNVTANTQLTFDFRSNQQEAEINGVGLIYSDGSFNFWQVHGTQNYKIQSHHNYSGTGFVSYNIPVGTVKTGQVVKMFFAGDEDNHVGQNVAYRSPKLSQ